METNIFFQFQHSKGEYPDGETGCFIDGTTFLHYCKEQPKKKKKKKIRRSDILLKLSQSFWDPFFFFITFFLSLLLQ